MSDLRNKAIEAAKNSYSPYSNAKVGSALETDSGVIYSGCNVENSSFGGTVCAERVAIWKMVSEGEKRISKIYVYTDKGWPPCGLCRQVMSEFASKDLEIIIGDAKGNETKMSLEEMLPLAFTPSEFNK